MKHVPNWVTLTDGEVVIWHGRPTIYSYLGRFVSPLAILVVGAVVMLVTTGIIAVGFQLPTVVPWTVLALLVIGIGILAAGRVAVEWWTVRYLVTSDEVYRKQGVISRQVQNLRLDQIQNTSFTQTVVGRLASHGDIHIETAGSDRTEVTFQNVPNPEKVLGYITEALDRHAS